ncbi:Uncharacterised protein [Chlamydia trachomatis]|nr:Uncharacterised protein [Chlamydia trachomatis]
MRIFDVALLANSIPLFSYSHAAIGRFLIVRVVLITFAMYLFFSSLVTLPVLIFVLFVLERVEM